MTHTTLWMNRCAVLLLMSLMGCSSQHDPAAPGIARLILQLEWTDAPGYCMASPALVDSAFVMVFQGPDLVVRRAMEILEGGARGRLELEVPVGQLRVRVEAFRGGLLSSWGETTVTVVLGATQTARVTMSRAGAMLDMVAVAGGAFNMGSPNVGESIERPVHPVTLSPFSIARFEVRQQYYLAVMGDNPAVFQGANRPVEGLNWFQAAAFCNALSRREGYDAFYDDADLAAQRQTVGMNWDATGYRLPTEAEWEYACRAGTSTEYSWGDAIDGRYCWFEGNSGNQTHDVGTRQPNAWGLHDMNGNVSEWCNDWFDPDYYAASPSAGPRGPSTGTFRVIRGGAYSFPDFACRSPARSQLEPVQPASICGFRPVRPGFGEPAVPDIQVSPREITFPFLPGQNTTLTITVRNAGALILQVDTVADDLPWLSVSPASFALAPGETQELTATANTSADLTVSSGTVVILSNDPDEPTVVVRAVVATVGISGAVTDAQTGSALADARVDLTGPVTRSTSSGADGRYEFPALSDGTYRLTATRSGYITESRDVVVAGQPMVANFSLSRELAAGQYRIVLTWGTSPNDLDSHLWVGDQYHIYYSSRGSQASEPFVQLDVDDTSGEGPETITIYQLIAGCRYGVYNFSGTPDIKTSEARVIVYSGNQVTASFSVPQSGTGRWWYVFDLSQSGAITPRDYLTDSSPGP
ncbi:SUMF1/EgtB/PvdO family nonheme iron enzyme [Candidatus Fermentibacteria bacterium]|nr:SUMF1/EgtB/PvdO family nonheme iron enzyme [Candidatus Fermentibacteria bacterium]